LCTQGAQTSLWNQVAQTPAMLGLCSALAPGPSARACVPDPGRRTRLAFVQPGSTGKFVHPGYTTGRGWVDPVFDRWHSKTSSRHY